MQFAETQLTTGKQGHFLNSTQVFSPDDSWIVYDTRNDDGGIGAAGSIAMVNVSNGEIKELYHTVNQTKYGPGVGAATFSPKENLVLFIHGIRNADEANPYGFTRRTAVAVYTDKPFQPVFMDARDVTPPFTAGALRGGTMPIHGAATDSGSVLRIMTISLTSSAKRIVPSKIFEP